MDYTAFMDYAGRTFFFTHCIIVGCVLEKAQAVAKCHMNNQATLKKPQECLAQNSL